MHTAPFVGTGGYGASPGTAFGSPVTFGFGDEPSELPPLEVVQSVVCELTDDGIPPVKNLVVFSGDSKVYEFTIKDENGDAVNLTDASVAFSAKRKLTDTALVFDKSTDDVIEVVDAVNGKFQVPFMPSETVDEPHDSLYYDAQIQIGSDVFTVARGFLTIVEDVVP